MPDRRSQRANPQHTANHGDTLHRIHTTEMEVHE